MTETYLREPKFANFLPPPRGGGRCLQSSLEAEIGIEQCKAPTPANMASHFLRTNQSQEMALYMKKTQGFLLHFLGYLLRC